MIEFVTIEEVKEHLRIDSDAADADLKGKIISASTAIYDFIQGSRDELVGAGGEVIADSPHLPRVKMATLIFVGILDRVRDGQEEASYTQGNLPFSVTSLIYSLRKPTIV